ncbi:MAG: TetR/AcrR family transcriptional regulator, partial [Hyphomicrobiales bacterium]|nr:TetR/AcrR family transcriptional regulator [Hyphomicrobiales bacterium]
LDAAQRALLARSLFSAVHGQVLLGLEEKLGVMAFATLREEVERLVFATIRGLEKEDQ